LWGDEVICDYHQADYQDEDRDNLHCEIKKKREAQGKELDIYTCNNNLKKKNDNEEKPCGIFSLWFISHVRPIQD
jgi:hypothetical protein